MAGFPSCDTALRQSYFSEMKRARTLQDGGQFAGIIF